MRNILKGTHRQLLTMVILIVGLGLVACESLTSLPEIEEAPIVEETPQSDAQFKDPRTPAPSPQPALPIQPPTAAELTIVSVTETSISISYTDQSTDEKGFVLERQKADGSWQTISEVVYANSSKSDTSTGQVRFYTDEGPSTTSPGTKKGLVPGTTYCYRVIAWNDYGRQASIPSCATTEGGPKPIDLRILTYNVFGQDQDCENRATYFGEQVANAGSRDNKGPYDIVGVQEYFNTIDFDLASCDSKYLSDAIWSTGRYKNSDNYHRFYPRGEWWQAEVDGGIGVFSLHPIVKFNEWEWSAKNSLREHGFIFARIQIPNTSLTVDTYIVHLHAKSDDCSRQCRKSELQQLANKISELSRDSGNPVIVMGDFNIGGPPSEDGKGGYKGNDGYEDIMAILANPRDLWFEAHETDQLTDNGYTIDDCSLVTTFDCAQGGQRIDYIFVLTDPKYTNHKYDIAIKDATDVTVVKWQWNRVEYPPVHRVSDHFGVEANLVFKEQN